MINSHIGILTDTISLDLVYFSAKFVESGFVTQTATTNILTKQGIGNGEKAYQLLNLVTTNYKIALHKQEWFHKFVAVFSSKAAYEDLALMLTEDPGIVHYIFMVCGVNIIANLWLRLSICGTCTLFTKLYILYMLYIASEYYPAVAGFK